MQDVAGVTSENVPLNFVRAYCNRPILYVHKLPRKHFQGNSSGTRESNALENA